MPSVLSRLLLFLSSYAPLWLILAIQNFEPHRCVSIVFFGLTIIPVLNLPSFFRATRRYTPVPIVVDESSTQTGDALGYVSAYLIPFLGVKLDNYSDVAAFVTMFAVLALIYTNSNNVAVNPLLILKGFHVIEVKTDSGEVYSLISKDRFIPRSKALMVVLLGESTAVETGLQWKWI